MVLKRTGRNYPLPCPVLVFSFCSLGIPSMPFCSPSHGKCGCWGKIAAAARPGTRTAGRTDPTCPTLSKSYRLLYIPSSTYFGKNWCSRFGAKIYAKTQKILTYSLINFPPFTVTGINLSFRFSLALMSTRLLKISPMHCLLFHKIYYQCKLEVELSSFRGLAKIPYLSQIHSNTCKNLLLNERNF